MTATPAALTSDVSETCPPFLPVVLTLSLSPPPTTRGEGGCFHLGGGGMRPNLYQERLEQDWEKGLT